MNVPYNNGKVQIGKYYQKPPYVEQDRDMLEIQGWLIGYNQKAMRDYWANIAYCCLLVVAVILSIIFA
jgi:hypothetical protein